MGVVGFGSSSPIVTTLAGDIDLSPGIGILDEAFSMSRDGTATSLPGFFSTTASILLPPAALIAVRAHLFTAASTSNLFSATSLYIDMPLAENIGETSITIPPGIIASGIANGSVFLPAQTRVLLVFEALTSFAEFVGFGMSGYGSAGLSLV
ncbi:MAG: hypothetical protein ACYCOU_19565 [Sulfobacillus sp.]